MAFDGIVFDLFHTLIDPEPLRPAGFDPRAAVAGELGLDEEAYSTFWEATYVERETSTIDLVDLVERHARSVGVTVTATQRATIDRWFGVAKDRAILEPPPELVALVGELASAARVGVLSNCYEREVRCWPDSPYATLVHAFVGSCFLGVMKPHPAAYDAVLGSIEVAPERAVFVGNGGGGELEGARAAGFGLVVHLNAFDRLGPNVSPAEQRRRAAVADASIDRVEDLAPLLRRRAPAWFR